VLRQTEHGSGRGEPPGVDERDGRLRFHGPWCRRGLGPERDFGVATVALLPSDEKLLRERGMALGKELVPGRLPRLFGAAGC